MLGDTCSRTQAEYRRSWDKVVSPVLASYRLWREVHAGYDPGSDEEAETLAEYLREYSALGAVVETIERAAENGYGYQHYCKAARTLSPDH